MSEIVSEIDNENPLLLEAEGGIINGFVDYKGHPVSKSNSGGWRSASLIIGVEVAESFTFYGLSSNLITYLTGPLEQSNATAAENVNAWLGTAALLPIAGAIIADSFLGHYRTIVIASAIYILGLALLTLSAIAHSFDVKEALFFLSIYLVAAGQGGHRPSIQAFGANQFDGEDPEESKDRSSFFNWWTFGICMGITLTLSISVYIQDYISWVLGFGIPSLIMILALVLFLFGTKTYRYKTKEGKSSFMRIGQVFVAALRNRQVKEADHRTLAHEDEGCDQFKLLNKALLAPDCVGEEGVCSIDEVQEAKAVLSLIPIWTTNLLHAIVDALCATFFTKHGATMDRKIVSGFTIPAATLQSLTSLTIIILVPIYDRIFVPLSRALTRKPTGITMLQRIGTGLFSVTISMVVAALVEMKRLKTAEEYGLVNMPNVTIPMSVWWLVPQYILIGAADVFAKIGLQELFYDQVPSELRSVGLSLYLSILGVGYLLSSFLVSAIDKATGRNGKESWFADNLN